MGFGFLRVMGDTADNHDGGSCVASDLDLGEHFLLSSRSGSLKGTSPPTLTFVSEAQLMGSRLFDYHYVRLGRRCSRWLRVYQLHQVLLLMLLLLLLMLLLLLWEASEVVKHVSRCLLLVGCRKQLDGEALVLAWNSSCWNGNGALLCLIRLIRNVHAKRFDDAREGEGGVRGGGGDPGKLVGVHGEGRQLNFWVGDGQHVRQAETGNC